MEEGFLSDASSRNALYKIHVSLGKIVNSLDEQQPINRRASRSVSVILERQPTEEQTVVEEPGIKEEIESDDEGTVVPKEEERSSLVTDLLSDDDDTTMQVAQSEVNT